MKSEQCPTCGATPAHRTAHGPDHFCSDACALRASDRLFETIEREIARVAPHISRDAFLQAMEHIADDLCLRSKKQYRPLSKTLPRIPAERQAFDRS